MRSAELTAGGRRAGCGSVRRSERRMAGEARSVRWAAVMAWGIAIGLAGCTTTSPQYVAPDDPEPAAAPKVTVQAANAAPASGRWLSGASGDRAAQGGYGK